METKNKDSEDEVKAMLPRVDLLLNLAQYGEEAQGRASALEELTEIYLVIADAYNRQGIRETSGQHHKAKKLLLAVAAQESYGLQLREKAGVCVIAATYEYYEYESLENIIKNQVFPEKVREAAQLKRIDFLKWHEDYDELLGIARGGNSETVRKAAEEALREAVMTLAVSCALQKRDRLSEFGGPQYRGGRYGHEMFVVLLKDRRLPEELRIAAGKNAFEDKEFWLYGNDELLEALVYNASIPKPIREQVGVMLVGKYEWRPDELAKLRDNENLPEAVRNAARDNYDKAFDNACKAKINSHVYEGEHRALIEMTKDPKIPVPLQEFAREKLAEAVKNMVHYLVCDGRIQSVVELIKISKEDLPEDLKVHAAQQAQKTAVRRIESYHIYEDYYWIHSGAWEWELSSLAKNNDLPQHIRVLALVRLVDICKVSRGSPNEHCEKLLEYASDKDLRGLGQEILDNALEETVWASQLHQDIDSLKKISDAEGIPERLCNEARSSMSKALAEMKTRLGRSSNPLAKDGETVDAPKLAERPVPATPKEDSKGPRTKT